MKPRIPESLDDTVVQHQQLPDLSARSGFTRNGLPFERSGTGSSHLVVLPGLTFENKPQFGTLFLYRFLEADYTIWCVHRRPGMPSGYTMKDMADDYAVMIRQEFGQPVDIIGISTGGSIALYLAADHPDMVRRLVIHSSAHILGDAAKRLQLEVAALAKDRQWRKAWTRLIGTIYPKKGMGKLFGQPLIQLSAWLLSLKPPSDPGDLVTTVEAEDRHAIMDRLKEISAPTLVAGGMQDFFYSPVLFRETAAGIPDARLRLYEKMGHPVGGRQFRQDVRTFLRCE